MNQSKYNAKVFLILIILCNFELSESIRSKHVTIERKELIEAINNANIQYTLKPDQIERLNFVDYYQVIYSSNGIDKYKIGVESDQKDILILYLPESSTVNDFVIFMLKKGRSSDCYYTINSGKSYHRHFNNTLSFCESTLHSPSTYKSFTINILNLLKLFLEHLEIATDKIIFHIEPKEVEKGIPYMQMIRYIVLNYGYFDNFNLNCFVFIPNNKTIYEFVNDCAAKVVEGNENDFMKVILNQCQSVQSMKNKKVRWSRILEEMKNYYHHLDGKFKFIRISYGGTRVNFDYLDNSLCLHIIYKLTIEFNNLIPRNGESCREVVLLNLLNEALKLISCKKNDKPKNLLELFIESVVLCSKEDFVNYYNLLPISNISKISINKWKFNEIVKEELGRCKCPISLSEISTIGLSSGFPSITFRNIIKFTSLPYKRRKNYDNEQLVMDYINYIKSLIDSTKPYDEVVCEFWSIFWDKQTLENYKGYLRRTKLPSKQFDLSKHSLAEKPALSRRTKRLVALVLFLFSIVFGFLVLFVSK